MSHFIKASAYVLFSSCIIWPVVFTMLVKVPSIEKQFSGFGPHVYASIVTAVNVIAVYQWYYTRMRRSA